MRNMGITTTGRLMGYTRPFSWLSWVVAPAAVAATAFSAGALAAGGHPRWVYALAVGAVAAISTAWGMVEYSQRLGARGLGLQEFVIRLSEPEEIDQMVFETAGLARLVRVRIGKVRGGGQVYDVPLLEQPPEWFSRGEYEP